MLYRQTASRWSWAQTTTKSPSWAIGSTIRSVAAGRPIRSWPASLTYGMRSYSRLSAVWAPTEAPHSNQAGDVEESHSLLIRAGFLRQSQAGIFHLLPLGLRVQQKLENLIDYHMTGLGASKVSLSSVSTAKLWKQSGRFESKDSELFKLKDRKDVELLLAPTHEEEITSLVAASAKSYRDLPVRLYQISRKYRDEQRPRQGLLRGREFLMKDLYTFDTQGSDALQTYKDVRAAYVALFNDLRIPYMTAAADSGSIGGDLSHEYHFPSDRGEDGIISCDNCGETRNEEVAILSPGPNDNRQFSANDIDTEMWTGISKDRRTLVQAIFPTHSFDQHTERPEVANLHAIKAALPDVNLDTGTEAPRDLWLAASGTKQILLYDPRLTMPDMTEPSIELRRAQRNGQPILLTGAQSGDRCSTCHAGNISITKAIEVAHTFHLGDRYSKPLKLRVRDTEDQLVNVQMGCHGIGVSRLIAAVAAIKASPAGLQWPVVMAPFSVLVIPAKGNEAAAEQVAKRIETAVAQSPDVTRPYLCPDVALDDRDRSVGWKLKDADLIGYPIVVIVGRAFEKAGRVEVQCRQLGLKEDLPASMTERDNAAEQIVQHVASL